MGFDGSFWGILVKDLKSGEVIYIDNEVCLTGGYYEENHYLLNPYIST